MTRVRLRTLLPAVLALACLGSVAEGQTQPQVLGPGEAQPEIPEPVAPESEGPLPSRVLPRLQMPDADAEGRALAGQVIAIRGFAFGGNTAFSDAELAAITRPYLGEERHYSDLLEARDRVTRAYVDAGYISSGAVLPRQSLADGIITLQVIEGRFESIDVVTDGRLQERYVSSRLSAGADVVNLDDLRERLRILKRDPRIDAVTAELIPAETRGLSLLSVQVEEAPAYSVQASFDNYAPPAIGSYRGRLQGSYANLTTWADRISLAYTVAEGLHDIDARWRVPVSPWDTTVELRVRRAWSEIVESPLDAFGIESRTQAYGVQVRQPVARRRDWESGVFLTGDWKRGKAFNDIAGLPESESTLASLRMGADGWWRGQHRAFAGRATGSVGFDILGASPVGPASDPSPNGQYAAGLLQLQYVEYLPWRKLRILARFDGQITNGSVLGLEKIAVGGHASVRGYRENLVVRDQAAIGSVELRVPLPRIDPIQKLELGVFSDAGHGRNRGGIKDAETLVGVGVGLHAEITRFVALEFSWAASLRDPSAGQGNDLQDDGLHFALHGRFP